MRRLDTRRLIRFGDATTSAVDTCPIDRTALLSRFHASEDGTLLSGATAFAAMWRVLEMMYLGFLRIRPATQRAARRIAPS